MKRAIITGIYGQDGSLLAEHLISLGYQVMGLVSKLRVGFKGLETVNIQAINIASELQIEDVIKSFRPSEFYHLAAVHHSSDFKTHAEAERQMLRVNFLSTQIILDSLLKYSSHCRFMYAGSSQMYTPFNDVTIINEETPYWPSTYYGLTKVASAQLVDLWRRQKGLWGVTMVLFNHESARRSDAFLSRKITSFVGSINNEQTHCADDKKLLIRDQLARTDWSAASDFVKAFHLSLQAADPSDYVLASGEVRSVEDFLDTAFQCRGLKWQGYTRLESPQKKTTSPCLQGNSEKAKLSLLWKPIKSFEVMIADMVENDKNTGPSACGAENKSN